jgi:hypothetical protein
VDDPLLVRRRQPLRDLQTVLEGLALRNRPLFEPLAQRLALEKLHDEKVAAGRTRRTGDFFE